MKIIFNKIKFFRYTCFLLLVSIQLMAQRAVPDQGGFWVHDEAKILSSKTRDKLEALIKAERDSTTNQIGILTIPSLEGEDIEGFSLRVAEAWKIGTKKNDNGALLVIAVKDKKMRIEVGQGLEGTLTDAISSRIIRNEITPPFRQGNYEAGVVAGVLGIIQAIKGQYVNTDPPLAPHGGGIPIAVIIFIILLLIFISRRGGGGLGGYWVIGNLLGGLGGGFGGGGGGGSYGGGGRFGGGGASGGW